MSACENEHKQLVLCHAVLGVFVLLGEAESTIAVLVKQSIYPVTLAKK